MTAYIVRRLLFMVPTLFGIMLVSFLVIQFAPGGPVERVIARITGSEPARGGSRRRVEVDFPLTRSAWGRLPRKAGRRVVKSGGSVFIYLIHTETAVRMYNISHISKRPLHDTQRVSCIKSPISLIANCTTRSAHLLRAPHGREGRKNNRENDFGPRARNARGARKGEYTECD